LVPLDLPPPITTSDLGATDLDLGSPGISDLPAPKSRPAIPAIAKPAARSVPADVADLPAPKPNATMRAPVPPIPAAPPSRGVTDLPTPKAPKPADVATRPAPLLGDLPAPKGGADVPAPKGFFDNLPQPAAADKQPQRADLP